MRVELAAGIEAMALPLDAQMQEQLIDYLLLLIKWNQRFNLTAVREPKQMVARHLLDSLSALHCIEGQSCLDVGSGGGLPGIPLAIAQPQRQFVLLDSNGKKARFLTQVKIALNLSNVEVVHSRIEDYTTAHDCLISRAFRDWKLFSELAWRLVKNEGRMVTMLGQTPWPEPVEALHQCEGMPKNVYSANIEAPSIPGESGARHLLIMTKQRV